MTLSRFSINNKPPSQRELAARLQREAARMEERAGAEAGAAAARAVAAQRALEAAEARAGALEAQLASRPTSSLVRMTLLPLTCCIP